MGRIVDKANEAIHRFQKNTTGRYPDYLIMNPHDAEKLFIEYFVRPTFYFSYQSVEMKFRGVIILRSCDIEVGELKAVGSWEDRQ